MTDAELADIMAMDALRDTSRTITLSNAQAIDIQNIKAILALANNVPDLVKALREDREKLQTANAEIERLKARETWSENSKLRSENSKLQAENERLDGIIYAKATAADAKSERLDATILKVHDLRDALDWALPLLVDRRGSLSAEDVELLKRYHTLALNTVIEKRNALHGFPLGKVLGDIGKVKRGLCPGCDSTVHAGECETR